MNESLTKARDCSQFCLDDLRDALGKANAVEAIVLMGLIEKAALLTTQIGALSGAIESDERA